MIDQPYYHDDWMTIYQGDCLAVLPHLPAGSVHAVVTSPPYWGLRRYLLQNDPHVAFELGHEARHDCAGWATGAQCGACWVCRLVAVFREVKRVLREDGCVWLNVGDAYAAKRGYQVSDIKHRDVDNNGGMHVPPGLKSKDLLMLPARLTLALQNDGWWLRSEIIWHKRNPLPESVKDRPTKAHEMVYLLTKAPKYFYDAEAVREPASTNTHTRYAVNGTPHTTDLKHSASHGGSKPTAWAQGPVKGRNLRSVWSLASEPTPFAHFATFPSALVRWCLQASCSAGGVCAACGTQYVRQVERTFDGEPNYQQAARQQQRCGGLHGGTAHVTLGQTEYVSRTTVGFAPACPCDADTVPPLCLDPFAGAGTTLITARGLGIGSVGIELNQAYCDLITGRIVTTQQKGRV